MREINDIVKGFKTAESRWSRFGPYYAMFPVDFAFNVVKKYSKPGDFIIDPFAGRSSSIFAGGVLGRHSLGIEINPIGWLYGSVKLNPANKNDVIDRLLDIYSKRNDFKDNLEKMSLFFRMCYCDKVLKFLLSARTYLDWQNDNTDATLMSIILVYLHGKLGEGLSNQMKMTKAMGINYSIKWWKKNNLINPPEINPLDFLIKKIEWRYKKGLPEVHDSRVIFGDSTIELKKIAEKSMKNNIRFSLLFTSPPYYSITDYHTDQWLRLWLLGGTDKPKSNNQKYKNRFNNKKNYYTLLDTVFGHCAKIMDEKSTIYVRTDKRDYTFSTTLEILNKYFPDYKLKIKNKPVNKKTQTELLGNKSNEKGEIDIILKR
jgi:DNA modification methylase